MKFERERLSVKTGIRIEGGDFSTRFAWYYVRRYASGELTVYTVQCSAGRLVVHFGLMWTGAVRRLASRLLLCALPRRRKLRFERFYCEKVQLRSVAPPLPKKSLLHKSFLGALF